MIEHTDLFIRLSHQLNKEEESSELPTDQLNWIEMIERREKCELMKKNFKKLEL